MKPYAYFDAANTSNASFKASSGSHGSSFEQKSNYQIPTSALYGAYEGSSAQGGSSSHGNFFMFSFSFCYPWFRYSILFVDLPECT
jgi:hypothetical protein